MQVAVKQFINYLPYWPSIAHYAYYVQHGAIFASNGSYNKSWHLNQCIIAGANGPQALSVPLHGGRAQRTPVHELPILYTSNWQLQHCKALQSAYGKAPFFTEAFPLVQMAILQPYTSLQALNTSCMATVQRLMRTSLPVHNASKPGITMVQATNIPSYTQCFSHKYAFVPHVSVLDLIFNTGAQAIHLLKQVKFND
jgi:hypothetical protein